uniref:Uncharacterized protein n=1 Tax=Oryctolagus cuniculus TaxID=9986 RepID=G1TUT4_RABIT
TKRFTNNLWRTQILYTWGIFILFRGETQSYVLSFDVGSKPSPHEEKSQERKLRGRSSVARAESESSCDGVSSRKRTISSEDSSHTGTGSCVQELSVTLQKKAKPSDDGNDRGIQEAHAEPRRANSRARSGHKRRRRSRSPADHPPPLRKSLVTSLRSLSEAIYEDLARVQAQQAQIPLTQEQLFALAQLRGPLCSAMQSSYALASQAGSLGLPCPGLAPPGPSPGLRPGPGPGPGPGAHACCPVAGTCSELLPGGGRPALC